MKLTRVLALAVFALPVFAYAHPGHEGPDVIWSFTGGAAHPLTGWDHLVTMIAVGVWAASLGGRNRWLVPAAFAAIMALGAGLGHAGFAFSGIEQGIAASMLVLGLLIASAVRLPTTTSMALAGIFALFHGLAHGVEVPATAGGLSYGAGFIGVTLLLQAAGLGLGTALKHQEKATRLAGMAVALAGAAALLA